MSKKLQTKTTKIERIVIWAIFIFMVASTIGVYASMFLGQKNQIEDRKKQAAQQEEYQKKQEEYQKKVDEVAKNLSSKYYEEFNGYRKNPTAFNASAAQEKLEIKDLKVGDGEEFTDSTSKFSAYYIGWKYDGDVFDSSFSGESLKFPLSIEKSGDKFQLIEGFSEGLKGMKFGGVREISIPSNKAYGANGSGHPDQKEQYIPPNSPLKFIVMLIPYQDYPAED